MNLLKGFFGLYDWVVKGLTALSIFLLIPMMFLVPADVIGRYLLKKPLPAVFEINANFLMVAVVFFPLAYVHQHREHIFVDLFTKKFPEGIKLFLDVLSLFLGLVAFGLIGWFGLVMAIEATLVREYVAGIIEVPIWISKWFVPVGCFVFCLELLRDGFRRLTGRPERQAKED